MSTVGPLRLAAIVMTAFTVSTEICYCEKIYMNRTIITSYNKMCIHITIII